MQNMLSFHAHADVQNTPFMPHPLTTMLGRQQEIAQLYAMFEQRRSRLITLSGPAGVGKTHLALTFVPMVASYFVDGSFFVDLATIRDASQVIPAIIRALGNERLDSLAALSLYLRDRHMLLLLDNFEQVLAASSLLCQLLSSCPYLTILVTSRSTLNIRGEYEFVVAPLALPPHSYTVDTCELMEFSAVQLFVQRAQAVNACFELNASNAAVIAEICRRLDGLPLAIELAAARSKHFSSFQLLTLLQNKVHLLTQGPNDLPTRQQTLYNTVQWSYELLQPQEQKLFRLCSVVRGVCTLELLGILSECAPPALMDMVTALINSSLLQPVEWLDDCYAWKMPAIIRDFGLHLLADCDELALVQNRYIDYYQQLALRAEHGLFGRERVLWQRRMHAEYENLQEIVHLFIEQDREHEGSAMGKVLYLSSFFHEHVEEEFSWLKRLLANHAHTRLSARARALFYLGASAFFQSRSLMAHAYLEQALQLYQDLEEPLAYARAACMLGRPGRLRGK
jgi:predicted ATPase